MLLLRSFSAVQLVGKVGSHCIHVGCKVYYQLATKWYVAITGHLTDNTAHDQFGGKGGSTVFIEERKAY